jgi:hypothetical protein
MIINGKKPSTNVCVLVLPRQDSEPIIFKARAVSDLGEFDKLCKFPVPPMKVTRDGKIPDLQDDGYRLAVEQMGEKKWDYVHLKSLEATEGLSWETVDMANPDTYANWKKECADAGMSYVEIQRITALVIEANSLNEDAIEKARKSFLAGQGQV